MDADREHEPVGEPDGTPHDIEMTVGDRIERPGKERSMRHVRGLARDPANRKAVGGGQASHPHPPARGMVPFTSGFRTLAEPYADSGLSLRAGGRFNRSGICAKSP